MALDILHRAIAFLGGKKLCALAAGVVLWIVYHKTGITPGQVTDVVNGAQPIAQADSLNTLLQLIGAYIIGQSAADGLSGGKTSSAQVLADAKSDLPQ